MKQILPSLAFSACAFLAGCSQPAAPTPYEISVLAIKGAVTGNSSSHDFLAHLAFSPLSNTSADSIGAHTQNNSGKATLRRVSTLLDKVPNNIALIKELAEAVKNNASDSSLQKICDTSPTIPCDPAYVRQKFAADNNSFAKLVGYTLTNEAINALKQTAQHASRGAAKLAASSDDFTPSLSHAFIITGDNIASPNASVDADMKPDAPANAQSQDGAQANFPTATDAFQQYFKRLDF